MDKEVVTLENLTKGIETRTFLNSTFTGNQSKLNEPSHVSQDGGV